MSQNEALLSALKRGERITTLEAVVRFGICRLSERIRELEREGWVIDHEPVRQNGKRFVRYALRGQLSLA